MFYFKNPSGLYCCIDIQTYTINNKPERNKKMNKDQPQELVDLQEKLSEIFWYVKSQAKFRDLDIPLCLRGFFCRSFPINISSFLHARVCKV